MVSQDTAHLWARLRFAVVGKLVASPPARGALRAELDELSAQLWQHPLSGEMVRFGFSTIEGWYYQARNAQNPIDALRRKMRSDVGRQRVMKAVLLRELEAQYLAHPGWSYQLHHDNLVALVKEQGSLGPAPSYTTVRRRMKVRGWRRRRKPRTTGQRLAAERLEQREVRSFEKEHVHELWHFDFHEGSRQVVLPDGTRRTPWCLCVLDDHSRLCCHIQWYLVESTQTLVHGQQQALQKRGLPRAQLSDNGGAMRADETRNGFEGLSITHETTLSYSPYQNAKQEVFWSQLEGRLMAMLENVEPLTLEYLNRATQAFGELEYNRKRHDELGMSPLQRALEGVNVARPCPEQDALRFHFTIKQRRTQRRSDGTVSIAGVRFEIPSRLRHVDRLWVRYQRWDLSLAYVVDPRDHRVTLARIMPVDKLRNADGHRRVREPDGPITPSAPPQNTDPVPPLLRQILAQYAASGMPPAYIPLDEKRERQQQEEDDE